MSTPDIIFPNIGIEIQKINSTAFSVMGMDIKWYGVLISLGVLLGAVAAFRNVKRIGLDQEMFMDFCLIAVPVSLIFTRLYFVVFTWNDYKDNLLKIFAFRDGGMGVYGGIIAGVVTAIVFSKIKKVSLGKLADCAVFGLIIGQAIGRWGNFFNQEAFGEYTNSLLAMRLKLSNVSYANVTQKMMDNLFIRDGISYIQVHPTFLYESLWNLGLFIALTIYRKHKKFHGELIALYLMGYGLGRFWIESLRTDQLKLLNTQLPVSQLVSALIFAGALAFIVVMRIIAKRRPAEPETAADETGEGTSV